MSLQPRVTKRLASVLHDSEEGAAGSKRLLKLQAQPMGRRGSELRQSIVSSMHKREVIINQ